MHSTVINTNRKPLLIWLGIMVTMVMLMVVVGGLTRLTDSGLSMVNWHPIHGTLPPIGQAEWQEEFAHYKTSPQYQHENFGMKLEEFKGIFWLEYIHRVIGRLVGLFFFLPLAYFSLKRAISLNLGLKLGGLFLLGGAQGLLGWYMVKSGLVDDPMVSPLRLSAHLSMACLLFSLLWWRWLAAWKPLPSQHFNKKTLSFIIAIFIQIILGAWVAGQDAGLAYDSFPTMNGQWMPDELWLIDPWWKNLYQSPTTAQFVHRLGALLLTVYLISIIASLYKQQVTKLTQFSIYGLIIVLMLQITLGALTVIHHVPILLATLHQFAAILLLGCAVALLYGQSEGKHSSQ